jgi:predicted kinase
MKQEKTLILLCGLPRSGKTTWALNTKLPTVSPDSIRIVLHGQPFIGEAEPMIWVLTRYFIKSLFSYGFPIVILDATNTTEFRRKEWLSKEWDCKYKCFHTSKEVCIERAKQSPNGELVKVIERMSRELTFPEKDLYEDI